VLSGRLAALGGSVDLGAFFITDAPRCIINIQYIYIYIYINIMQPSYKKDLRRRPNYKGVLGLDKHHDIRAAASTSKGGRRGVEDVYT
jgi:hypothetical protein